MIVPKTPRWIRPIGFDERTGQDETYSVCMTQNQARSVSELAQARAEFTRAKAAVLSALRQLDQSGENFEPAHEVKNVLQTILMGMAYLRNNFQAVDENVRSVISEVRHAVRRAKRIVRGTLQRSAVDELEMKEENLNSAIVRPLRLVNCGLIRAHIAVVLQLAKTLPPIRLDLDRMEQVFVNLFLNAIHAMPQGGALLVRTRTQSDGSSKPLVIAQIQDTGSGIPEANLGRVFDPFFTTKPAGAGMGLGLSAARRIVEQHGGSIQIQNVTPVGVMVTLRFNPQSKTLYAKKAHPHC
jgi:signal transduction histidine kinase